MRRRLERFIPIVMLVVLVQLLAPIAAFRAVASSVSDPLAMASICAAAADSGGGHSMPANGSGMHDGCCAACGTGLGGPAVSDPPPAAFVVLQRQYQRVVWLEALNDLPVIRTGSNAQARAPPTIS